MQIAHTGNNLGEATPADAWIKATVTTANSMMSLAAEATNAALSMWTAPLAARSQQAAAAPAPSWGQPARSKPVESSRIETTRTEPARSWYAQAASPVSPTPAAPVDTGSSARSWYRAPYRSPFDPAFWMIPGHPVDHVQDWIAAMPMAASMMTAVMAAPQVQQMMPRAPAFPMPTFPGFQFFAMPGLGMPSLGMPSFGMPKLGTPSQPGLPGADLWLAPWQAMFEHMAASAPAASRMTGGSPSPNVIDFAPAFAAYRSAGGHAVAQIARSIDNATGATAIPSRMSPAWPDPFGMLRWLQR